MVCSCKKLSLFILIGLISACDLADKQNNDTKIVLPDISAAQLKQIESRPELETYLKNGLEQSNILASGSVKPAIPEKSTTGADSSNVANAAASNDFSTTNTQEIGVDEADRIEFDGEYLYLLTEPDFYRNIDFAVIASTTPDASGGTTTTSVIEPLPSPIPPPVEVSPAGIRVMQRGDNASMNEIAWLKMENQNGFQGLYLSGDVLAAVSASYGPVQTLRLQNDIWFWGQPETRLDILDVSVPAQINIKNTLIIDGQLISSRRIDNKLILVTRYTPRLPGFLPYPATEEQKTSNSTLISESSVDDLLPKISINGSVSPLLSATDCYIPKETPDNAGYANLTVVSIIDMTTPESFSSSCFNAISHGIYVSPKSLYITSSDEIKGSKIHKFSLNTDKPLYVGSGSIPGYLGWRDPAYRMNESGDYLRVVSTRRSASGELEHFLTILQDNNQGQLLQVSQLPNDSQPAKIGKPREDIQAVRYFQDRAYIVTFLRTDPLYVIDVADASSPAILGELEIPGFSSYLHPVNENLLLGFGQQTWANTKMSLFDVSDPSAPKELKSYVWENTSTPLRWDPKALAFLKLENNRYRFTFPTESWANSKSDAELFMFDLSIDNGTVSLPEPSRLVITADNARGYAYGYNQRSVIQGDEVHYVYDYRVWSANWDLSVINPSQ